MTHGPRFDVIAIGDTTEDVFLLMREASLQCDLDTKQCKICFDYADKLVVEQKTEVPGVGNAANHAVGTARLGLRVGVYTVVGRDAPGEAALAVFRQAGVDTQYVAFDPTRGTNYSVVINFRGERTIFVYHEPRDYQLPDLVAPTWAYLTSAAGEGVQALHRQVLGWLGRAKQVKLAFNPGSHQIKLGKAELASLLQRTEWLFLNREECQRVLVVDTREVKALIAGFHALGVKRMVLTDGPSGAYASDGAIIWHCPIFRGSVVERTGAGDAFGSGFLSAVVQSLPIAEALLWGTANATSVVQYIGAREGLLTEAGVKELIRANADIAPREFGRL